LVPLVALVIMAFSSKLGAARGCVTLRRAVTHPVQDGYPLAVRTASPLADLDDGALARRIAAAAGSPDSQAESEFYRRLAPRVRLYGLRHLRDRHAAADLVQQVLLMTLQRLRAGEVREPERIASFVLGACRMTVLEMRRGTHRRETLLEAYGDMPEAFETPEPTMLDPDRLAGCLGALAERERSVVVLTFFEDKAGDEVGAQLGISAGNVRVIRHRALAKLRDCMGGTA
jgi:RNA polymerase sigma-70 factor (ECF subfamily)